MSSSYTADRTTSVNMYKMIQYYILILCLMLRVITGHELIQEARRVVMRERDYEVSYHSKLLVPALGEKSWGKENLLNEKTISLAAAHLKQRPKSDTVYGQVS